YSGMSFQYARIAAMPRSGLLNGVSRNTASSLKTEQMVSTSPRSQPLPKVSIRIRKVSFMAPKYSRSGYEVSDVMSLPQSRRCTMLKTVAAAALLAICALPLAAQQQKPAANAGNDVTLTGQVIDVNCYTTMGASGAAHKQCAAQCAKAGVALAILSSDGTIYMPVSSKPADPQNSRLEPFAESQVKVTGVHRMSHGMHTIEIKTIAAAT